MKKSQEKKRELRAGNSVWSGRLWVLNKACCPVSSPPSLLEQTNHPAVHFLLSFSDSVPVKAESTTPSQDSLDQTKLDKPVTGLYPSTASKSKEIIKQNYKPVKQLLFLITMSSTDFTFIRNQINVKPDSVLSQQTEVKTSVLHIPVCVPHSISPK